MSRINAQKITWRKEKLSDVLSLIIDHRGKTPTKLGGRWAKDGIPALSAKNIKGGQIVNDADIRFVDLELYNKWMPEKLDRSDILLTSEAPLGEMYYLGQKENYCLSQRLFALRSDNRKLDSKFLYYYLLSPNGRHQLTRRISGTAAEGIRQAELRQIDVVFPESVDKQRAIANILTSFDSKIENNNRIIKILEEMAQAIFKEWFVKFRFPGHEKAEFVGSELGRVPRGWEAKRLGDVIKLEYGKALKDENRKPGKVAVVGSNGIVGSHDVALVKGPGIVVGRKGTAGAVLWLDQDFFPIDTTFYVRTALPIRYSYLLLRRQKFITGDSAVPGLNRDQAYFNTLVLPRRTLLDDFEKLITPMFEQKHVLNKENNLLSLTRDLLLPKLMSGKVGA